jgi:histidinol phosphatase-like PHP family hydrolase
MELPRLPLLFATLLALWTPSIRAQDEWVSLFDGKSLAGWKASEHRDSFSVTDGLIYGNGPRAHLFYVGAGGQAEFENFELELEAKPMPGCNSGVYFHATWQDANWPRKSGFEVQINNTQPPFDRGYSENKKTGSLYGVRNLYKAMVKDDEWFTMNILVKKPRVEVRLNGKLMMEYTEPANQPVLNPGTTMDFLTKGTFALQCHDEKSQVWFRNIRVRRLPPGEDATVAKPVLDTQDLQRAVLAKDNFPLVNLRTRADGGPTLRELRAIHGRTGLFAGRLYQLGNRHEAADEAAAIKVLKEMRNEPVFTGLEVSWPGERSLPGPATLAQFDYILGRCPVGEADHADMDGVVERRAQAMTELPIDVLADPLQVPASVSARTDELWTEERMRVIIAAAVKNGVALEISSHDHQPSEKFIALAKTAGAKFTVGDDGGGDYTDWSYVLEIQKKLGLTWRNMWVPGHEPTRTQRALAKP